MPNSYLLYTANGSTTDFSLVGIDGWISSSFLKVYANNVLQTTGYSFIGLTGASPLVRFAAAPTDGTIIRLQRETPATVAGFQSNIVNFNDASVLTEADLDNMAKGLVHIAQENNDTGSGALPPTVDTLSWDAKNKRITSVATPIQSQDAATKGYVDGVTLYGTGMALPQSWTFSGNASTTSFTLSPVAAQNDPQMFIVEIGGVIQRPTTDYTIPNVNTITFAAAPPSGSNNVRVRNIGTTRNIASFSQNLTINGVSVGRGNNDQSLNTAVGSSALSSNTTGINNTGVGYQALKSVVSGTGNTALGASALSVLTTTTNNTAVGAAALNNLTTGTGNTALGWAAGLQSTATNYNTALGYASLALNTTGSNNTSVGANALTSSTTSSFNTAVGAAGLANNTTGDQNTAVGYAASNLNTTGSRTTAIGSNALQNATTPLDNTAVGAEAARYTTTGVYNNAFGSFALFTNTTGGHHTALGHASLFNNTTGNFNIGVGHATLHGNTTGSGNIAVGVNAGRYIADGATTASKVDTSIFIGTNSKVLAENNENSIVIGNNATGLGSNTTVIGNSSTVSTTLPGGILSIPGGGIKFPATQVSSADANTLDDYAEGTWTPVIRGSTTAGLFTYTSQQGIYTKIGRLVTVHVNLVVNTVTTAAVGNLEISGLPFNAGSGVNFYGPYVLYHFGIASSKDVSTVTIGANTNFFGAAGGALGVDGTQAAISAANVGAGDFIRFTATFTV